jgi:hypothetical protein
MGNHSELNRDNPLQRSLNADDVAFICVSPRLSAVANWIAQPGRNRLKSRTRTCALPVEIMAQFHGNLARKPRRASDGPAPRGLAPHAGTRSRTTPPAGSASVLWGDPPGEPRFRWNPMFPAREYACPTNSVNKPTHAPPGPRLGLPNLRVFRPLSCLIPPA